MQNLLRVRVRGSVPPRPVLFENSRSCPWISFAPKDRAAGGRHLRRERAPASRTMYSCRLCLIEFSCFRFQTRGLSFGRPPCQDMSSRRHVEGTAPPRTARTTTTTTTATTAITTQQQQQQQEQQQRQQQQQLRRAARWLQRDVRESGGMRGSAAAQGWSLGKNFGRCWFKGRSKFAVRLNLAVGLDRMALSKRALSNGHCLALANTRAAAPAP